MTAHKLAAAATTPLAVADIEIRSSNLLPDLQAQALGFIADALSQGRIEKDAATVIKRAMDDAHKGQTWHCIVGQDFGASLNLDSKNLLFVRAQDKHVLLFRSFDQI